jgi:hypothetical protein
MTDEEARQGIRDGFRTEWLIKNLLAVYERYRMRRKMNPSKALEQTNLCYMATHGAAIYDVETGLFSEVQWSES